MNTGESGSFLGHFPCFGCGGHDPLAVYRQSDGKHTGFCFSNCGYISSEKIEENFVVEELESYKTDNKPSKISQEDLDEIMSLECRGWKERKLTKKTCEKFGVRSRFDENGDLYSQYYPMTKKGEVVGFKQRILPKDFSKPVGNTKANNDLFGQSVWEAGGKYLAITTGECDCLALAQVLNTIRDGNEYWTPVVSVTAGDGSIIKQLKNNFEFINSFDKVVLMFDMDEAAQKYVNEAARLLNPGKAHIAKLPLKDPNDMLVQNRVSELRTAFFKAERFSPVDVCTLGQLWEEFEHSVEDDIIPLPPQFSELADLMGGGPAAGEVTVIGALTSVGKSTVLNNMVYHVATHTPKRVGLMYLESSPREIVRSFLSIHTEQNLALQKYSEMDMEKLKVQFQDMIGRDDKIVTVNHNGSFTSVEQMFEKIRWLVKGMGCELVVVDPLQAAVPSNENNVIDSFMDSLLKLAKETMASIVVVSHMKKPDDDKPHAVSEYSLKGSSAINQIAFNTILMSRDKVNKNEKIRNSTKLTLVKCRRTGLTSSAGWLRYNPSSAKIEACSDPYEEAELAEFENDDFEQASSGGWGFDKPSEEY